MMKRRVVLFLSSWFLMCGFAQGQGLNNDYSYDDKDWTNILELQGIHVFKFPFELKKGEYVSLSYEVTKNGTLQEKASPVEDFQREMGFRFNHHTADRDIVLFYRIYTQNADDSLNVRFFYPGSSGEFIADKKIGLAGVAIGIFNTALKIDPQLSEKTEILYYYGLLAGSEKYRAKNGYLECTTGLFRDAPEKEFDFVITVYAERITKERAKTIFVEN